MTLLGQGFHFTAGGSELYNPRAENLRPGVPAPPELLLTDTHITIPVLIIYRVLLQQKYFRNNFLELVFRA